MGMLETQSAGIFGSLLYSLSAETKILIKESIMAARENANFNADKSLDQTDSVLQTNTNEFKVSGAGNFQHDQAQGMSNDSAVAEEKGFSKEQTHGVAHDDQMSDGDDIKMVNQGDDGNSATEVPNDSVVAAAENSGKEVGSSHGQRKKSSRTSATQRKKAIKKTVYVSDIDTEISEEQLAELFSSCGQIVDCRICGDPNSALRFGFVEFSDEEGATNALSLAGTMLGSHTVKVQPSRTAIAPVDNNLLPRSEDEIERCTRTIYVTNIDKKVNPEDVRLFFESFCGEVLCIKLLSDRRHSTSIGFLEFATPESAIAALKCSGVILGDLPIRVSPSKTPIKQGVPRSTTQ